MPGRFSLRTKVVSGQLHAILSETREDGTKKNDTFVAITERQHKLMNALKRALRLQHQSGYEKGCEIR